MNHCFAKILAQNLEEKNDLLTNVRNLKSKKFELASYLNDFSKRIYQKIGDINNPGHIYCVRSPLFS